MKPPFVLGLAIGGVLLVVLVVLPRLLPGSGPASPPALVDAQQSLVGYDPLVSGPSRVGGEDVLTGANFEALATRAEPQFTKVAQDAKRDVDAVADDARKAGVRVNLTAVPPMSADNLKTVASNADAREKAQIARLTDAVRSTTDIRSDNTAAAHLSGVAQLAEAADRLAVARRARLEMRRSLSAAAEAAARLRELGSEAAYFTALRDESVQGGLRETRDELSAQRDEVAARVEKLGAQVQQREARLTELQAQLSERVQALSALQDQGSRSGGLDSYQARSRELISQVRDLQAELQLLQNGGREGATMKGGNGPLDALIEGGTPITPLEMLRQDLAGAEQTLARLEGADQTMQGQMTLLQERSQGAGDQLEARRTAQATLRQLINDRLSAAAKSAEAATELESRAVDLAQKAGSSFNSAKQAAMQWKTAAMASAVQYDPQRRIGSDNSAESLGIGGLAQARYLAADALHQRAEAIHEALQAAAAMEGLEGITSPFDVAALKKNLEETQVAGRTVLTELVDMLTNQLPAKLPGGAKPLAGASLVAAQSLLSRLDPAGSAAHRNATMESLKKAIETLGKHPELGSRLVAFRDVFTPPVASAPTPTTSSSGPASGPDGGESGSKGGWLLPILKKVPVPTTPAIPGG